MSTIQESIVVNVPVHTAYNQWTQFEEFPRFMEGVLSVKQIDDTHLHWHANIGGKDKEWDAEITEQVPDQRIAWRSTSMANNNGLVTFQPLNSNKTQVALQMEYEPEGLLENVGDMLGVTTRRVRGDLERFKQFIESRGTETGAWRGEVHGGQAQPSAGGEQQEQRAVEQPVPQVQSGSRLSQQSRSEWLPSSLLNEGPFTAIRRLFDDFDRLFDEFASGRSLLTQRLARDAGSRASLWAPRIEVSQREGQLVVCAELPGINKDEVNIEIDDNTLIIEGERRQEREEKRHGYYASERNYGSFYRRIPLPEGINTEETRATMNNGVLEITFPLPQRQAARKIQIQESSKSPANP